MHLPHPDQLCGPDHLFLYHHDLDEFHCTNPRSYSARMYRARFEAVLKAVGRCAGVLRKSAGQTKILDLGCAQGNFSLTLAEQGFKTFAVDLRHSFLRYANLKYDRGALYCINASLEALPFRESFDIILLGEVIEHVAYPDALLKTLGRLLAPGGFLIVTTPNGGRLFTGMPTLSQMTDRVSLAAKQFGPDADDHLYLLTRPELEQEARKNNLIPIYHSYYATPWITGRIKLRFFTRWLPMKFTAFLDNLCLSTPILARLLAEGQLMIFKTW